MSNSNRPVSWASALSLCRQAGNGPLVVMAVLAALQAVLPLAGLLAMMQLVDAVADGIANRVPQDVAWSSALMATAIAAAVALFGGVLRSLSAVVNENHGRRLSDAGVQSLQELTARLDLAEFDKPGFHDAMQRAGQEAGQRPVRLTQDLTAVLVAVLSLATMTALLVQVELWLPVMIGVSALPIAWARRKHARIRFEWHREHVVPQREVGYLGASLSGRATAKDVRVLGLAVPFAGKLLGLRQALRTSLARLARLRARDELLVHTLASGALFAAYVYLASDALAGAMTLGGLVLHAQAAQRTQNAVRDLLASATGVHEHRLFLRPLRDLVCLHITTCIQCGPSLCVVRCG
ncbi:MAG TPA: ABC transporter ATP-binding protein, partial [Planctomycetes bacterium]|nr:ABC transporter ATP-binding protein [Planctomycetota bacterium]